MKTKTTEFIVDLSKALVPSPISRKLWDALLPLYGRVIVGPRGKNTGKFSIVISEEIDLLKVKKAIQGHLQIQPESFSVLAAE